MGILPSLKKHLPMDNTNQKKAWETYREEELRGATLVLHELGFTLDSEQPHITGERYLMSGKKLVLLGTNAEHTRVVIKISSDIHGKVEIRHEREARETLLNLAFAYFTFLFPKEILYTDKSGYTVLVTQFIEQEQTFISRPTKEQFFLAIRALKTQEGTHATTSSHTKIIKNIFGIWEASDYIGSFKRLMHETVLKLPQNKELIASLHQAEEFLLKNSYTIDQYCGFLTHTDFVPHNLRVHNGEIYLLDHTGLRFGNKYESWARFLNFMTLYNRELEEALVSFVKNNRTPEEHLSLRLMRVYKIGFLLSFYAKSLEKTEGDLHTLTLARIEFWRKVLESILQDSALKEEVITAYKNERDSLRSFEEKERQLNLH
jgi:hypothetical protein